jgi:hypothetical protein
MARRLGKVIGASLLLVGWTSVVVAEPAARFDLSWNGPPGCPTAENVQARVEALLGDGASGGSVADVRASGQVERVDNGFRLLLTMGVDGAPSSRVIEAGTCDELAGAAAIAIALLARSTAQEASAASVGDGAASEEIAEPPPVPPPSRVAEPAQPGPAAEAPPAPLRFLIDAPVAVAGWGSLPSTGLGVGAALGIRWKALRATAGGELWLPQTHQISGFATRFTLQSGRAGVCLIQGLSVLELGPCLGAAVQRLNGQGLGSETFSAESRTVYWVSGTAGIFASLPTPGFQHLRWFAAGTVLVSPSRPRFVINQLGPVHEPALASTRLDLGCEWIF